MTIELRKELKSAGFPCAFTKDCTCLPNPTLSELIEACGDRFGGLEHWPTNTSGNERWESYSEHKINIVDPADNREFIVYGKTPEEAVAKLWLALNKKERE